MTAYLLRAVDDAIWRQVANKANHQGITIRAAIVLLLEGYASGRIKIEANKAD
jgi:hypothetical protein